MKDVDQDTGEDLNPSSNNLFLGKDRLVDFLFIVVSNDLFSLIIVSKNYTPLKTRTLSCVGIKEKTNKSNVDYKDWKMLE